MSEDIKDLILNLGGEPKPSTPEPAANPAPVPDPNPSVTPDVSDEPDLNPTPADPAPADPKPADPAPKPTEDPKAKAFAEMRTKNAKYERALSEAAKEKGMTIDEYLADLENKTLQSRATNLKTDPEVLRRLEAAEAELNSYKQQTVQNYLVSQFESVKKTLALTDQEVAEFTDQLQKRGHNFLDTSTDYTALYRGLNYEKMVEKERQAWIARDQQAKNQGSNPSATVGRGTGATPAKVETTADLDKVLEAITGK